MWVDPFNGRWNATATSSTSEIFRVDEPVPNDVADRLNSFDATLMLAAKPVSGLILTINAARSTFTEKVTGNPAIEWYDVEGVLTEEIWPFGGTIVCNAQGAYLRPKHIPDRAIPVDSRYGHAILRYDDGDTQIADNLRIIEGRLVRSVNVVTDEAYLHRVIIVYERAL